MDQINESSVAASARRANEAVGYGPDNPEPPVFHDQRRTRDNGTASGDALDAAAEYLEGRQ